MAPRPWTSPPWQDILVRISRLAAEHAEVLELDCGPVLVSPAGALVLDARVRIASPKAARRSPRWTDDRP